MVLGPFLRPLYEYVQAFSLLIFWTHFCQCSHHKELWTTEALFDLNGSPTWEYKGIDIYIDTYITYYVINRKINNCFWNVFPPRGFVLIAFVAILEKKIFKSEKNSRLVLCLQKWELFYWVILCFCNVPLGISGFHSFAGLLFIQE